MRQDANNEIKEIEILQVDKFISKRIVRKNLSRESTNQKKNKCLLFSAANTPLIQIKSHIS